MSVVSRVGKFGIKYQVKVRGSDGHWITETFQSEADAIRRNNDLELKKFDGFKVNNSAGKSVSEYFVSWEAMTDNGNVSTGWRKDQIKYFRRYVEPSLGHLKLRAVTPAHVSGVLAQMKKLGRAPQTRLHIYNLMHKMFEDAIELFELIQRNPVKKSLKPVVPTIEAKYLPMDQSIKLLSFVVGKSYDVAIWLAVFVGLRAGEVQALKWESVDFDRREILVCSTYLRKEKKFQPYPKGKKQHRIKIPAELLDFLKMAKERSTSPYVAALPGQNFLQYEGFLKAIKRYCAQLEIGPVSPHGLRHSTSEIWMEHGADREDLRQLFSHSSSAVTDRYVHNKGSKLEKVSNVVRLFPRKMETSGVEVFPNCSQKTEIA
ncbi:MAG: site-specific integrase [Bdellovibrionales bacterium]|nr:site-specific integrase [Bdellovibrionales bacterium]